MALRGMQEKKVYFLGIFRTGSDSGFLIYLNFPDRSGLRIFNFTEYPGPERIPDFNFFRKQRTGPDSGFSLSSKFPDRSGFRILTFR